MILDLQLGRADRIIWNATVNKRCFGLKAVPFLCLQLLSWCSALLLTPQKKAPDAKILATCSDAEEFVL